MPEDHQEQADRRLAARLEETGAWDPRGTYRELLKRLKELDEDAYRAAVVRFRDEVLPAIAEEGGDPLQEWLEFGLFLAEQVAPGRTVLVEASGRSTRLASPGRWSDMLLRLPDTAKDRAIPLSVPPEPSPAQQATLDLLVHGKVRPSEG